MLEPYRVGGGGRRLGAILVNLSLIKVNSLNRTTSMPLRKNPRNRVCWIKYAWLCSILDPIHFNFFQCFKIICSFTYHMLVVKDIKIRNIFVRINSKSILNELICYCFVETDILHNITTSPPVVSIHFHHLNSSILFERDKNTRGP